MSITKKLLQAASGNAGSDNLYVEDVFSTYLYTGNSSTQTITNGLDLAGEGGMVWHKRRTGTGENHYLYDTERGAAKSLRPNGTNAENDTGTGGLTSFNSNGYTFGTGQETGHDYVGWSFRKAEKFFDVVHETVGSSGTVSHNLGSTPGMIIRKRVDDTQNWFVWHRRLTSGTLVYLDLNIAEDSSPGINTVTDSSFGHSGSAGEYVWYVFAHNAGGFGDDENESIITCNSYTGTGSAGLDVDLGWEPHYLLVKNVDNTDDWWVVDSMRGVTTGGNDPYLKPNTTAYEESGQDTLTFGARGFTIETFGGMVNESGSKYIYMAIRRPMKTPEAGTEVFASPEYTGNGSSGKKVTSNINMASGSMAIFGNTSSSGNFRRIYDSLRGQGKFYYPNDPRPESTDSTGLVEFLQDGVTVNADSNVNSSGGIYSMFSFKRATGFFDIASRKSTQTGVQPAQYHNLGVVPEMMISKSDSSGGFYVYHSALGLSKHLYLSSTNAQQSFAAFGSTLTATRFQDYAPGSNQQVINYLFATLAGVSKVGSYTGTTGSDVNVDCGFSAGARFVLIKRANATGGWYVWDSVRGIVSGDDPYLLLNDTDAEVTNTDYIDPLSSGFTVTAAAPAQLNTTNDTYIFLAIA